MKQDKHLLRDIQYGGLREDIGMKTYLHGLMDYAKNLKLRFRVGDLDLSERRKIYASVIRLSLGKILVNLWQLVKRTNTPLIPQQNSVVDRPWVFGSWVRSPPSTTMVRLVEPPSTSDSINPLLVRPTGKPATLRSS